MAAVIIRFGEFDIDLARVRITASGRPVEVQPQVFSVIEYLIGHRDRVVTKEELLDEVWGDRFVGESTLTSRIKSARRALGDDGTSQRVIRTVHGRGYQFVADVAHVDESDRPSAVGAETSIAPIDAAMGGRVPADPDVGSVGSRPLDRWPFTGRHAQLESIFEWYRGGVSGGVVVQGPSGIGTSRLAAEVRHRAQAIGLATGVIVGSPATARIPLAALGHLLGGSSPSVEEGRGDLALSAMFHEIRSRIVRETGDRRPLLVVDGVADLDDMTVAVLESLMADLSAFCVIARSDDRATLHPSFGSAAAVAAGRLNEIRLSALNESEIDILLYRTLGGPIDRSTLGRVATLSDGRPGVVRDIVDASIASGALVCDDGVWRLVGPPTSEAAATWEPDRFSEGAQHAAETLALLPRLPDDLATHLCGDEALDELDRAHLLDLVHHEPAASGSPASPPRISLTDPLLAARVIGELSPRREERLKSDLVARVLAGEPDAPMLAAIVSWGPRFARRIDDDVLVATARGALFTGDFESAGVLIDGLPDGGTDAAINSLRGELALRRGQWDAASRYFAAIDLEGADDATISHVLRRRASIAFYAERRQDEAFATLRHEAERRGGRIANALLARSAGFAAHLGDAERVLRLIDGLTEHRGMTSIEITLARAAADLFQGRTARSLASLDDVDQRLERMPAVWSEELRDGLLGQRCSTMITHGEIVEASRLVRDNLPIGQRTMYGFLPSIAAETESLSGRPLAALEILRPVIRSSHRDDFPQYRTVARSIEFGIRAEVDPRSVSRAEALEIVEEMELLTGELRWHSAFAVGRMLARAGHSDDAEPLFAAVVEHASVAGAHVRVADALAYTAVLGLADDVGAVVDRFAALIERFDGTYWPIRLAQLRAIADRDGRGLAEALRTFELLGYRGIVGRESIAPASA